MNQLVKNKWPNAREGSDFLYISYIFYIYINYARWLWISPLLRKIIIRK